MNISGLIILLNLFSVYLYYNVYIKKFKLLYLKKKTCCESQLKRVKVTTDYNCYNNNNYNIIYYTPAPPTAKGVHSSPLYGIPITNCSMI